MNLHDFCVQTCPRVQHTLCKFTKHNQLHQLKPRHANTERNALHLQNKTACRDRGGRRGLRETREMSSILRDKSPALPSTACPWRSRCNRPHTGSESVTHCPRGARTHWNAKTYRRSRYYKAHNHCEVRMAALWAWSETARLKEVFQFHMGVMAYIVTSVLSGHRWSETALASAPLSASSFIKSINTCMDRALNI